MYQKVSIFVISKNILNIKIARNFAKMPIFSLFNEWSNIKVKTKLF